MSLEERWKGEMEYRTGYTPGPSQDTVIGYRVGRCRCLNPSQQLSAISICPQCEGIRDERRLEALSSIRHANINRPGGKETTTREEHSDVRHDLGIVTAPEPQYQKMKIGERLLDGEKFGMGMEAPEQHFQVRNAEVGQQGLKQTGTRVTGNGFDSKQGAFKAPEPRLKADDIGVKPQSGHEVAVRSTNRDSDPEYEPGAIEDDDSSSPNSTPSLAEDS